jgi:hypothetical protein
MDVIFILQMIFLNRIMYKKYSLFLFERFLKKKKEIKK